MITVARLLAALAALGAAVAPAPAQPPAKGGATTLKPIPISVATAETRPVQRSVETVGSLVPWQDFETCQGKESCEPK